MRRSAFLEATGQAKAFWAAICVFIAMGATLVWALLDATLTEHVVLLISTLVVGALVVGLWLCLAVRCPRCNAKIVWIAVHDHPMET